MSSLFDTSKLRLLPLSERANDLAISAIKQVEPVPQGSSYLDVVADRIVLARGRGAAVVLMMGAHVIRAGVQKYIIDLMRRGFISCIAMNGAGMIHDFEFALIGATTESVAKYIREGQFGLWKETGLINDYINQGYREDLGMGEAVGQAIYDGDFPCKDISLLATGYKLKIPVTVHVGIGYDIIHEHPNCDGAATGATSYRDFLCFAKIVENLEGGVVMNFGSAVMAPEVFLKALSMARNVAHQRDRVIKRFSTLVCDLQQLPDDYSKEPPKDSSAYYFRPLKTMLVRTVVDGGESFYVNGNHADTVPQFWTAINKAERSKLNAER